MPTLKKCYYQVLGVERNAGDEEIKKSFRKLALQLHPDKNPDRADEAKAEFQILQQAYEVLSNPQERAWYDEHRQAVLREGLDPDFDDFNIDLMAYCTSSCYKGFTDDDDGFYAVYRDLFSKLTAEELEAGWADENEDDIPNFGDSQSSYEEVVGPFYAFWGSFCTMKSFAWNDEYDTRRAECRRIARLMDKENKKIRTEAKKGWNREVRALVDFVRRKDKRVQAWKTLQEVKLKQKEEELAKKAKEVAAQRLAERKRLLETVKSQKKHHNDHHNPDLHEMEKWMSNEFGEQLSGADSDEESPTCFHCGACNKSFRTEKAFMNHEKSKKHLQQVEKLRELMKEEDELFEGSDDEDSVENVDPVDTEPQDEKSPSATNGHVEEAASELDSMKINASSSSPEPNAPRTSEQESEEEGEDELLQKQIFVRSANRNKKSKNKQREIFTNGDDVESDHDLPPINLLSSDEDKPKPEKSTVKKAKKNKKQAKAATVSNSEPVVSKADDTAHSSESVLTSSVDLTCMICKTKFNTRTELFRHIKSSGHAAPLESVKKAKTVATASEKQNKKRKGKRNDL